MKNEIINIFEEAWKSFTEYYDKKAEKYSMSLKNIEEAKKEHWICWNESDLMAQLARFFL